MELKNTKNCGYLMILAAFFWGTTFVAQREAAQYVGPFTWVCVRALLAVALLIPTLLILRKLGVSKKSKDPKKVLTAGFACGCVLFCSTSCQQIGMGYTSAGKAGFITSLYIVLVPILRLITGKKTSWRIWICVLVATAGLYLLSVKEGFSIGIGDSFVFFCAVFFSVHILVVDKFSEEVDAVELCLMQFLVSGVIAIVPAVLIEHPVPASIVPAFGSILYAALFSSCIAYTIQIIGQRYVEPARASLMMCLESVFALLSGWTLLGEQLTAREGIGCALMFLAIIGSTLLSRGHENEDMKHSPVVLEQK